MASNPPEPRACSVARTLDIVGEKWALLAVREVFLGNRKFDEMVHRTGAPRDTLAARLRTLRGKITPLLGGELNSPLPFRMAEWRNAGERYMFEPFAPLGLA